MAGAATNDPPVPDPGGNPGRPSASERSERNLRESGQTMTDATVIPPDYEDLLGTTALAYVATVGPDGEPQNTPVWFDWEGEFVKFS